MLEDLTRIEDGDAVVEFFTQFHNDAQENLLRGNGFELVGKDFYAKEITYDKFIESFSGLTFEACRRLSYAITLEGAAGCLLKTPVYGSCIKQYGRMMHRAMFFVVLMVFGVKIKFD